MAVGLRARAPRQLEAAENIVWDCGAAPRRRAAAPSEALASALHVTMVHACQRAAPSNGLQRTIFYAYLLEVRAPDSLRIARRVLHEALVGWGVRPSVFCRLCLTQG